MKGKSGRSGETAGVDGVSTDTRERQMPFLTPRLENATEQT